MKTMMKKVDVSQRIDMLRGLDIKSGIFFKNKADTFRKECIKLLKGGGKL